MSLQSRLQKVDDTFDEISKRHAAELKIAKITPIHREFLFAQNGICAMIAGMGAGKTYNYLKLAAKQQELFAKPVFEEVVICSTSGEFDKTVQTFKSVITKSKLTCVKDTDLMEYLDKHIEKIALYNILMRFINSGFAEPDEAMREIILTKRLYDGKKLLRYLTLTINDLGFKTYPCRMLLIMDDFASHPLLKRKETELSRMLKKLRHYQINVIICVQTVKSIPKDIKRNLSDLVLFPGIS
jgi:hypothetical protein